MCQSGQNMCEWANGNDLPRLLACWSHPCLLTDTPCSHPLKCANLACCLQARRRLQHHQVKSLKQCLGLWAEMLTCTFACSLSMQNLCIYKQPALAFPSKGRQQTVCLPTMLGFRCMVPAIMINSLYLQVVDSAENHAPCRFRTKRPKSEPWLPARN